MPKKGRMRSLMYQPHFKYRWLDGLFKQSRVYNNRPWPRHMEQRGLYWLERRVLLVWVLYLRKPQRSLLRYSKPWIGCGHNIYLALEEWYWRSNENNRHDDQITTEKKNISFWIKYDNYLYVFVYKYHEIKWKNTYLWILFCVFMPL